MAKKQFKRKFEKYVSSGLQYKDYKDILDSYLGKEKMVYCSDFKKEISMRKRRWSDLDFDDVSEATQELCWRTIELLDLPFEALDDVVDHWSDVMSDWVSESELEYVY